ncbi:thiamine pyrophosphate-dependent dehydrogenase E1 component subunit alpha [Phytohabitans rumicis]|uniref:Dehydrogenase E1 component n=1 Tax=Phytohabitans rumicis TaxID=1076125 RepID=A0A6V8L5M3_9ACTN|nr:thiamine pyrophosphate-dependent dehydrogenase E1 component subunit alpha [Phytohabitans rumicis]GFJ87945.1 dehydrogenase E1 component [Phytohabitans rumicis]
MRPSAEGLYRTIRLIRRFEERAIELVRSGDIGSGIHPCIGQEAVAAGVCAALRADDVLLSNHRGHGHLLAKGSDPARFMAELTGRVTGIDRGRAGSFHPSDFAAGVYGASGTVGHGAAIAAGVAWALAQDGGDRIAVSVFGDGAVTQGALLESFNLASLWRVPVVFVCENNGYATTLPAAAGIAGTVVGRAAAFDIPGSTVDGQDPDVVYDAMARCVARARAGDGPSLVEFLTYRYEGHHTFERKVRLQYRDPQEASHWPDPLAIQSERVPEAVRETIDAEVEAVLDEAVRFALDSPRPDPLDAFDHLYATGMRVRAGVSHA